MRLQLARLEVPTAAQPLAMTSAVPSVGSLAHHTDGCKPCAFIFSVGCENGVDCKFCHLCAPGEKKRRKKIKKEEIRLRNAERQAKTDEGETGTFGEVPRPASSSCSTADPEDTPTHAVAGHAVESTSPEAPAAMNHSHGTIVLQLACALDAPAAKSGVAHERAGRRLQQQEKPQQQKSRRPAHEQQSKQHPYTQLKPSKPQVVRRVSLEDALATGPRPAPSLAPRTRVSLADAMSLAAALGPAPGLPLPSTAGPLGAPAPRPISLAAATAAPCPNKIITAI